MSIDDNVSLSTSHTAAGNAAAFSPTGSAVLQSTSHPCRCRRLRVRTSARPAAYHSEQKGVSKTVDRINVRREEQVGEQQQ